MEKNVGRTDQIIRIIMGLVFLFLAVMTFVNPGYGVLGGVVVSVIIYLLIAALALVTGILQTCGIYMLLGINTCKVKQE